MRIRVEWPGHSIMLSRRTITRAEETDWRFPPLSEGHPDYPGFEHPPEFARLSDLQDRLYEAGEACGLSGFWAFIKAFYLSPGNAVALTLPDGTVVRLIRIPH